MEIKIHTGEEMHVFSLILNVKQTSKFDSFVSKWE
jgi:hypothetical protein